MNTWLCPVCKSNEETVQGLFNRFSMAGIGNGDQIYAVAKTTHSRGAAAGRFPSPQTEIFLNQQFGLNLQKAVTPRRDLRMVTAFSFG
ncbi:hypothetical protein Q4E40_05385 [Pontibacter sp. BT731]|uniref:hypothetical protein n=1 Tax=Pontibacter coccineus TaxID=3063328 RepID=UPI0026E44EA7|nr:hypothetical protein [Pontibacter sp. BT731]MDO6389549.1 hypothetical protein [Pontibacter sp. BT731]